MTCHPVIGSLVKPLPSPTTRSAPPALPHQKPLPLRAHTSGLTRENPGQLARYSAAADMMAFERSGTRPVPVRKPYSSADDKSRTYGLAANCADCNVRYSACE
jgi:hypothetical protein